VTDGVVVVDKPAGMTSHDVVDEVRRLFRTRKVGHAGTLDPDATGVLVLGLGKATRLLDYARLGAKRYMAQVSFGVSTSTQDASGEVLTRTPCDFTQADLLAVVPRFTGPIEQVPPMVSAVRVGGERLHAKARRGEVVERAARQVVINELKLRSFSRGPEPGALFEVRCSAGTYVRTLAHDLGAALGCGAHLSSLRRTEAAGFEAAEAIPLADLGVAHLLSPLEALRGMPRMEVAGEDASRIRNGAPLQDPEAGAASSTCSAGGSGDRVAVVHEGVLLGVYRRDSNRLVAERVMPS
jgi:tRNA pseudouridine55 synthase